MILRVLRCCAISASMRQSEHLNIDAKQEGGVIKNIAVWEVHSEEDFYQGKCDTSSTSTVWAYSPHFSLSEAEATVCADEKEYILLFVAVNNE